MIEAWEVGPDAYRCKPGIAVPARAADAALRRFAEGMRLFGDALRAVFDRLVELARRLFPQPPWPRRRCGRCGRVSDGGRFAPVAGTALWRCRARRTCDARRRAA